MNKRVLNSLMVCLSAFFLVNCSDSKSRNAQGGTEIPVKAIEVQASQLSGTKDYVGTVEESSASSLSFEVPGNVQEVLVSEGQRVRKGQLLAVLDKSSLKSAHNAAVATLHQAEDAYRRLTQLHDNNSLPEIKYVEMQTNLEKARSAESIARKSLHDANLYAPFAGVIGDRSIEPGMNVLPSQSLFKLLCMDHLKVRISIPENEIAAVSLGQKAQMSVAALADLNCEGMVDQKGVVANTMSHTYEVKIRLTHADAQLMPGMVCKVLLGINPSGEKIVIPNQAVQVASDGSKFVWIAKGNRCERREIVPGDLTDYGVTISDGLQPGDKVIVEGYQKICNGTKIKLL